MKTIATLAALLLHITALWQFLPAHTRTHLAQVAAPSVVAHAPVLGSVTPTQTGAANLTVEAGTSAYAIDLGSGQVLYAANATTPRPIASVTKVMTVMVALDHLAPAKIVTIGKLPDYAVEDETLGLVSDEQMSVSDLIKAALIPSDNDAADALAIATSGSVAQFAVLMNQKANEWGIQGAHFTNSSGLIDTNLVSAAAMAKIAELALTNPTIKATVDTPSATIHDTTGRTFALTTTNDLLASGNFYGIKTGYTLAAGECFVGLAKIDGHQIVTVVLGSSDRFGETQDLVNWIGSNWSWN